MTAQEIRAQVPPMVIWMADAAIREARRAITGKKLRTDINRNPYNLPEVEMAGEILFRMISTCTASIMTALLEMPDEMNGSYFDEFIKALGAKGTVTLRKADWVLDRC